MTSLPRPPRPATSRCVRVLLARLWAALEAMTREGGADQW